MSDIIIYAAGTSDGKPGHAGVGLLLLSEGKIKQRVSEYIGIASAEQATYQACIRALNLLSSYGHERITIYSDNASLVSGLALRHHPALPFHLSSLHKRLTQQAKYHSVTFAIIPSDDEHLQLAYALSRQAVANWEASESPVHSGEIRHERQALQQSAGGVIYKRQGKQIKICLIAKKRGQIWGLPKGRLQPGESWEATAVREVLEETGHLATIEEYIDQIDYIFYWKENHTLYYKLVAFFLMPVMVENQLPPDGEADKVAWFPLDEALHKLYYQSERDILRQARLLLLNGRPNPREQ